jgi:hypothetical protein
MCGRRPWRKRKSVVPLRDRCSHMSGGPLCYPPWMTNKLFASKGSSCLVGFTANLTSGGMIIPTTVPRSGRDGSRRAAPLCKEDGYEPAEQRRRFFGPRGWRRPGSVDPACVGQDVGFYGRTFRHHTLGDESPQRDQQFPRQCTTITCRMRPPIAPARSLNQRT